MKMNAWMRVGAIGFAASLFVAGCVVNSTTDNGDGGAGTGGSTGGTGGSTGGTGGSTGGTAGTPGTGGSSGAAGSGGAITCNPNDPNNSQCDTCMQTTCCTAWEACEANQYCPTEFACIKSCIDAIITDAGAATPSDKAACANGCVDQSSGSGTIQTQTSDLFGCANDPSPEAGTSCAQPCFGG